jgi:uncharacterized protein Yka (UPF0111/DUF47 family)
MNLRRRWLLPETPDVLSLLREQLAIAQDAFVALEHWASGTDHQETVNSASNAAKDVHRRLVRTLRHAFVLPLDPEDAYAISRGIDAILRGARDLIRESEVIGCPPDLAIATMVHHLREALEHLDDAIACLSSGEDPTPAVDAAIATERRVEQAYRRAMASVRGHGDLREAFAHRELYRRCARIGEVLVETAERAIYADVKER